jgi:hypothetical protein
LLPYEQNSLPKGGKIMLKKILIGFVILSFLIEIFVAIRDMPTCKILDYWSDGLLEYWV